MRNSRLPFDGVTADRLLDGDNVGHEYQELAAVLYAAAGPGQPTELAGRSAALAAFRGTRPQPASPARRPSMIKSALLRLLTVKAAAVAALAMGAGGAALAASTGTLPNPLTGNVRGGDSVTQATSAASPSNSRRESPHSPAASPSPSLTGLCHAYLAMTSATGEPEHGKALDSPAFRALITAAGGQDKVDAYCADLLAASSKSDHPGGTSTNHSSKETKDRSRTTPDGSDSDRHTGQSGKPSD